MDIRQMGDEYVLTFRYDPAIIAAIKATIPSYARRYDVISKTWFVHSSAYQILQQFAAQFGVTVPAPTRPPSIHTKTLQVIYLGKSKLQPSGEAIHNGTTGEQLQETGQMIWDVVIAEQEMRRWFHADNTVSSSSLYGVLGLAQTATVDEIKSGFRRMARQWHPDVCHEDNAQEMFMRINKAYETLSDPKTRVRYDAGLKFEAIGKTSVEALVYVPPLRCGMITGQVKQIGTKQFIEKIEDWQDIIVDGQVLVTSWRKSGLEKTYVRIIGR